ncbi:haloacid dehalogenase-like hydrolase [Actinomyces sp. ICM39]|uniref:HAD hydrolase-like protein n=1 Tax=Actinomyces sp. ICM39 TaxID=1105029 RepID=UPI000277091A|nr:MULTISPECIES: HAD hydrolase-like protein [Actinomycetaceae]EJN46163.1 haloacid dehalogenase-like hydrolase [Actinomyces sp. ICM39]
MSLSISVVLFDVDGTIVDSAPAVMNAFRGALSDYDLPIPDDQRLRTYVGPPLWYSFSDLGYEGELLANLVSGYRARYHAHYLDPEPFPGVIELLHDLHRAGIPLATATSKQAPMALAQMEHLGLSEVFDVIAGATPDPASSKATVIREALTLLEARGVDTSHPVIIGDSIWDVRGAQEAGIPVIGVGWGYATEDGLDEADAVCETVEELRSFILDGVARRTR